MKKKVIILFSLAILLILPFVAHAVDPLTWVQGILDRFLDYIVWPLFIGAIVIMLVYAGFLFVTAAGDPSKVSKAKSTLIWAVVGIVVGILAFSAVTFIRRIIGS